MSAMMKVVGKNLKLLIRSKSSALVVILGPLLVTLLVGLAFNNSTLFNLKVATFSPQYDELTTSFLDKLQEQNFLVTRFDNEENCVESVKLGVSHACMVFPPGLDIAAAEGNEIAFYVDNSRVNIVYTIMDTISAGISSRTREISSGLVQVLVDTLGKTKENAEKENANVLKLIEQNEQVRARQKEIEGKLSSLDLSVESGDFNIGGLRASYDGRLTELYDTDSKIRISLNESREILDGMSDPNATSVEEQLTSIENELDDLGVNGTDWVALTALFDDLDETVTQVSGQLSAAGSARSDVSGITGAVKATLDTNLNTVMTVKGSLGQMASDISAVEITDVGGIVSPIRTRVEPVAARTYISFLYPSLVSLLVMFTSVLLGSTLIMSEKRSRAFFRNLISPIKSTLFVYSTYVTVLIVLGIQLVIVFALTEWGLKIPVLRNLPSVLFLTFIVTTVFTLMGILIGSLFSSEETATMAAISTSSAMLFLSNLILPLESMPQYLQQVARFNPFVISEHLLRQTILFKQPIGGLLGESYFAEFIPAVYLLLIYVSVLFMAVLLLLNVVQKMYLFRHVLGITKRESVSAASKSDGSLAELLERGKSQLAAGQLQEARGTYIAINESYTRLSQGEKKHFYPKIVQFHEQLDKAPR
ncbi:ABC transporter permease [Candidatus Woesearchaeota archaeon]|nr:ABC transporter permease [Candidatus Woesearchaeota archaeon]